MLGESRTQGGDGGGQQSTKENRMENTSDLPKDGQKREGVIIVRHTSSHLLFDSGQARPSCFDLTRYWESASLIQCNLLDTPPKFFCHP